MTAFDMPWATEPRVRRETIPSYLYIQYNDDDDLQAFVESYNTLMQSMITWLADVNLPVYTSATINGFLLDIIGTAIYGQARPLLPSGSARVIGPFNTWEFNALEYNQQVTIDNSQFFATTDDVYKRIITWNYYKGDGTTFSVRWLKRRIMRFLLGENGADPGIDNTYQISVTAGVGEQINITIIDGVRNVTGGALFNDFTFNSQPYNALDTVWTQYVPLALAPTFKAAVDAGVLQMPFQYDWVVTV